MNDIINITKARFNALIFLREAMAEDLFEEVAWFEAFDRKLLALIARFREDNDYGFIIFARDERKVFRFHKVARWTFSTQAKAYAALRITLETYRFDGKVIYEESPVKKKTTDLFKPVVNPEKFHPFFARLYNNNEYEAARNIIQELAYHFYDVDGNYLKDFQTTEFNARLWELFLHIYLAKNAFKLKSNHSVPDFCLDYYGYELTIEAVTVNYTPEFHEPYPQSELKRHELTQDYMPIKFARTLSRKLKRKSGQSYWEMDHVKGKPFLLALHDYHAQGGTDLGSMTWSRDALPDYLYGHRIKTSIGDGNRIIFETEVTPEGTIPVYEKINGHYWDGKSAPSGFFFLPNGEHISAILFANNATLATFNRMGKLGGFGGANVNMMRVMTVFDHEANNFRVKEMNVDDPAYDEDWGDSIAIYHNPVAKYPLDPDAFPNATHFFWDETRRQITAFIAQKYVLSSYSIDMINRAPSVP